MGNEKHAVPGRKFFFTVSAVCLLGAVANYWLQVGLWPALLNVLAAVGYFCTGIRPRPWLVIISFALTMGALGYLLKEIGLF